MTIRKKVKSKRRKSNPSFLEKAKASIFGKKQISNDIPLPTEHGFLIIRSKNIQAATAFAQELTSLLTSAGIELFYQEYNSKVLHNLRLLTVEPDEEAGGRSEMERMLSARGLGSRVGRRF